MGPAVSTMTMLRAGALVIGLLALAGPGGVVGRAAQLFRAGVVTVPVTVTVTDAAGRLVEGLQRDDFEIFEDGDPQAITQFTGERVPVSLGILLDTSDSMRGRPVIDARTALDRFVSELLAPGDEAFVATFNHATRLAAFWTRPPTELSGLLDTLVPSGGTAMYDALHDVAPLFERRTHVRSALVVISDGSDTASDHSVGETRAAIQRADAFVYAIAIDADDARASTRVSPEALREITTPSGGYTEVIRASSELAAATARIAQELNAQYTLAYNSPKPADGQWRSIRVRLRNPDLLARARRGYLAMPQDR